MSKSGMRIGKITWNHVGFQQILNSDGVRNIISSHTDATCAAANANLTAQSEGFKSIVKKGKCSTVRWTGFVYSTDHASLAAEMEEKALSRAVR